MRVLVDTSAWIDFYHPKGDRVVKHALARALDDHDVGVVAPVIAELLAGAPSDDDAKRLQEDLRALQLIPLGWDEAELAGRFARALIRAGRRTPMIDLLIAAAAHRNGYEVWHAADAHYAAITSVGGPVQRNLRRPT